MNVDSLLIIIDPSVSCVELKPQRNTRGPFKRNTFRGTLRSRRTDALFRVRRGRLSGVSSHYISLAAPYHFHDFFRPRYPLRLIGVLLMSGP